ncbi:MAG TPA: chlorite dismutase family protein [Acidimicrobiales bacterium]|nr:chlorite dismutase family protein [Acidimicrobiales bacterium]
MSDTDALREPASLKPREGWGVLHLFAKVTPVSDPGAVLAAVKTANEASQQVVSFAVLGHKADLGLMLIGPDLVGLRQSQSALARSGLELASSYLSLTEVSEYARGMPADRLDARLHPQLPPAGKRAICFYPMSKRRAAGDNWYRLNYDERAALMHEHGASGRRFAGRVLQLVTGSTGLDDYEWGVTLFATTPDDLKECVHTMRFDEASARYADFGPFYSGVVAPIDEALSLCGLGL